MPRKYQKTDSQELSAPIRTGAAYIRVSTDDQLEYSPESQLEEIQAYCYRNNILLSNEHIYIEEDGRSGRKTKNRAAFQTMIAVAKEKPKPFDVILLWKYSRFARNQDESTFYKSMLRKKLGIDVVSISEPIMDGMYGRLIEMIIEWQDEFYSVNLSTEVTRSMRSRAKKGLYNGKMPLGYSKKPDELPVIVEEEAHIIRTIFQMFVNGYDRNYIVRYVNDRGFLTKTGKRFDVDAVKYILENPFYIGKVRWNRRASSADSELKDESEWIIADSHHEPLIDQETWDAAQKRTALLHETYTANRHPVSHTKHWLSGMVKCPYCGKSLSFKSGYPQKRTGTVSGAGFQCLGYRSGLHNESQYISEKKLTAAVLSSLHKVLESTDKVDFKLIRTSYTDQDLERRILESELFGLDTKEKRIKDAYVNGIDSLEEYKINRDIICKRREELQEKLQELQELTVRPEDYKEQFLTAVGSVVQVIESDAPYELKGEALRSVVQKIVLHKESDTLEFHYYLMT